MEVLFYTSITALILSIIVPLIYKPKNIVTYPLDEKPMFARFLGCGFELSNFEFRKKDNMCVRYSFFYLFWLPIFPDTCYGIKHIATNIKFKKITTYYHITHKETKSAIEIFIAYLWFYSLVGAIIGGFGTFG